MATNPYDQFDDLADTVPSSATSGVAVAAGARDGSPSNPYDRFDSVSTSPPVDPVANVGMSGVSREERQRQIAEADRQLNLDGRRASLDQQEAVGRAAGIGGRSMLQGLAAIPDIFMRPVTELVQKTTGHHLATIGETMDSVADWMGAPRANNAQERVASDMTAAIAGSATGIGLGRLLATSSRPVVGAVGNTLAADPALQMASAAAGTGAAGATREAGGGVAAQLGAGVVGGFMPGTAGGLAPRGPSRAHSSRSV